MAYSEVYKILSRCYCYPDNDFVEYANTLMLRQLEISLGAMCSCVTLDGSYRAFVGECGRKFRESSLEDLQVEHTGLFIHPSSEGVACYPYESVHSGGTGRLAGATTQTIQNIYESWGLRVAGHFADLADHIAAELEFLYIMSVNRGQRCSCGEKSGCGDWRSAELDFLVNHVLRWVPSFSCCLRERSDSAFFAALSQLTVDVLLSAKEQVEHRESHNRHSKEPQDRVSLDLAGANILEATGGETDRGVRWVYSTSPEKYWQSPVAVKIVDGRAEKIIGRDDVPFYGGQQDVRAFASLAKLYSLEKLRFPLKRVGKRGEGKFKRISWDEALDEIAYKLRQYRDKGEARQVAFLRTHPPMENLFGHFTRCYGSPNDVHTSGTSCYADGKVAEVFTGIEEAFGDHGSDDYINAEYALCIGHTPQNTVLGITRTARFAEAVKRGMKCVFVDPRLSEGSYIHGSEWIPIKPGTDAVFVLALMHVIIREGLYDRSFLLERTNAPVLVKEDRRPLKDESGNYLVWDLATEGVAPLGQASGPSLRGSFRIEEKGHKGICRTAFELLCKRCDSYSPEVAAQVTGIPRHKIEEIGLAIGKLSPRVCLCSQPNVSAQYSNSFQAYRARHVLSCLLGIYDKAGGKHYGPSGSDGIQLNHQDEYRIPIKVPVMGKDRVDYDPNIHVSMQTSINDYPLGITQHVLRAIQSEKPYPIRALFIIGCDVLASRSHRWREAFEKLDFIVKSHVWPDDDVDYADIILPEAAYLERDEGFAKVCIHDPAHKDSEFCLLSVIQQVVKPRFEERAWPDYVKDLAQRLGFEENYDFDLDEYWNFLLEPTGIDMEYLRERGVYYPVPPITRKPKFGSKTKWSSDTGRLAIYSPELAELWHANNKDSFYDPIPSYHQAQLPIRANNEFVLLSGKCSYFKCNFYRSNAVLLEKYLEGELGNTRLWMNGTRAASLGISDGDWVAVHSDATGQTSKVRVKVTEGIHPSAVWHTYGVGRTSKLMGRSSRGKEGMNVQDFVVERTVRLTAGAAHCEAIVKVFKVKGEIA